MTRKEYNQCVRLYSDNVFRFLLKQLANRADAEDILQISFEKLWKKRTTVDFEKSKSYLFSIAHNSMIDHIRRKKFVQAVQQLPERGGNEFSQQLEAKDLMEKGLVGLSPIQKSLVLLRDYEGYSYEEIGSLTELTLSQVKVYLFRARKKMKATINQLEQAV